MTTANLDLFASAFRSTLAKLGKAYRVSFIFDNDGQESVFVAIEGYRFVVRPDGSVSQAISTLRHPPTPEQPFLIGLLSGIVATVER